MYLIQTPRGHTEVNQGHSNNIHQLVNVIHCTTYRTHNEKLYSWDLKSMQ